MSDSNGVAKPPPARVTGTPVSVMVECVLQCAAGRGLAFFTRDLVWPGVPAVGQAVSQRELPWSVSFLAKVTDVQLDLDAADRLSVILEDVSWDHILHRHATLPKVPGAYDPTPGRGHFMCCVSAMVDGGWTLNDGRWLPTDEAKVEKFGSGDFTDEEPTDG